MIGTRMPRARGRSRTWLPDSSGMCVTANCKEPPLDFAGGKLGLMRNGGTAFAEFDDTDGTTMRGRSATFRLTRVDPCLP